MTGAEAREAAQLNMNIVINSAVSLKYLNEGIEKTVEKYNLAGVLAEKDIEAIDDDTYYEVDSDLIKIEKVTDSHNQLIKSNNYDCVDVSVKLPYKGNFKIKYRKYPNALENEMTEIPLPRQFHRAIGYYVAYKEALRLYGSNHSDTATFLSLFNVESDNANATLLRKKPKHVKAYFND